jgi:hypothetical protein
MATYNTQQQNALRNFLQTDPNFKYNGTQSTSFLQNLNQQANNTSNSSSSSLGSGIGNTVKQVASSTVSVAMAPFVDQLENYGNRISTATVKTVLDSVANSLGDLSSGNWTSLLGNLFSLAAKQGEQFLSDMAKTQAKLFGVTAGSGAFVGDLATSMREELSSAMETTTKLGMTVDDFLKATETLLTSSGRMALYNKEAITSGVLASMAYTKSSSTLLENTENFRNVGYGLQDAARVITIAGQKTLELGLNAKVLSDTLVKNLDKLNQFGFNRGIEGLTKMAQEAQGLNFNMDNTFKIADQLFDPQKAIDMSANLAMLGGAIGDFGDPLRMIYDATNNVEGLQTSLIKAARSLTNFDEKTQTFRVTGANLRRAKMLADQFGMSMGDLTNLAVKSQQSFVAMGEINTLFPGIKEDEKKFLSNISTLKDGKLGLSIPDDVAAKFDGLKDKLTDGFISFDKFASLSEGTKNAFIKYQQDIGKMNAVDIARGQFNATTQILNVVSAMYIKSQNDARKTDLAINTKGKMDAMATGLAGVNMNANFSDAMAFIKKQAVETIIGANKENQKIKLMESVPSKLTKEEMLTTSRVTNPTTEVIKKTDNTNNNNNNNTPTAPTDTTQKIIIEHRGGGDITSHFARWWSRNPEQLRALGIDSDTNPNSFQNVKKMKTKK